MNDSEAKAKANAFFAESLEAVPFGHPLILRVAGATGHALYQRVWEEVRPYMVAVPEADFPFMLYPITERSGVMGWERPVLPNVENPRLHAVDRLHVVSPDEEAHGLAEGEALVLDVPISGRQYWSDKALAFERELPPAPAETYVCSNSEFEGIFSNF